MTAGICWEKAFSEANVTFTDAFFKLAAKVDRSAFVVQHKKLGPLISLMSHHAIASRLWVGLFVVIAVYTVWYQSQA